MVRFVLKYVYLALGSVLAAVGEFAAISQAEQYADPDNDGEDERNYGVERARQREDLERSGEARSPMEAATYRANELVRRPIRTILVVAAYQVLFVGLAAIVAHTETVADLLGTSPGLILGGIAQVGTSVIPGVLLPVLVPIGVVVGLVFALVIHQSLLTAQDIRRQYA